MIATLRLRGAQASLPLIIAASLLLSAGFLAPARILAEGIEPAKDRPQPKSPADSARSVKLPPGFRFDLVASEPLVREPSAMAFDERGRLYVCEIHGYNLDGYLDIVELNKTGVLDREVRRVRHATPESQAAAHKETYGTVRQLRDTDGDGRMDVSDVWADRLPPCYGVIASRGGVIVVCAPDILFLADRDGDGKAEVRETLFTGFARELIERGMSNPRQGPDNWIYVAAGGGGGQITGPKLTEPVVIGQTDFRFKPDGSAIEPVTGRESMFGLTLNDFGDRFHTIVTYAIPLPHTYLARNPFVQSPAADVGIAPTRRLFPISQPDPWRQVRGKDPAWIKFYGAAETQPNGQFTASSGQVIYRADQFPLEYRGNFFVCDPANNLIHRCRLERQGSEYVATIPPEHVKSEFLASSDQWFRPMNLSVGPDGAIYVVDMYREIIEDFSAIPRFLQQQYAESLIAGKDHGRIWRLSWQGDKAAPKALPVRLDAASPAELVATLDHPNHWWRDTAQRLLVERQEKSEGPALAKLVRSGKTPQGRMQALNTLDGIELLKPDDVLHALGDESYGVRISALQLGERWLDEQSAILDRVVTMVDDPDPRVRIQLALTLGQTQAAKSLDALAKLAVDHGEERYMSAAVISSITKSTDAFLARLLKVEPLTDGVVSLLQPIGQTIGGQRDEAAIASSLQQIASLKGATAFVRQHEFLEGLQVGLSRGKASPFTSEAVVRGIERLFASASADVSEQTIRIAGLMQLSKSPAMQAAWSKATEVARGDAQPLAARLAAVSTLAVAPWEQQKSLTELLDARQPPELQLAVVKAIGNSSDPAVPQALLANWTGLAPKVQEVIVDALFARQDRLPGLLDAIEQDRVPAVSISALRREQLTEHSDKALRQRARTLLSSRVNDERAAVIKRYVSALTLPRDPKHGEAVFMKNCAKCHKLGNKGLEVGPDLLAVRTRPDESLLTDILDPSGSLARGYTSYAIATSDGRVHTGLLAGEAATSVTLRNAAETTPKNPTAAVVENIILRRDIEEMKAMSKSLMPEGLEKELVPQDVADLIGFLRQSLGPVVGANVVLFDDEPDFLKVLTEGDAKLSLTRDDKQAGDVALLVSAGQRHSSRIPGWQYQIVENPLLALKAPASGQETNPVPTQPHHFRYLRFAWKSAGAKGVMLELAASGAWPSATSRERRYYSGQNKTTWAATEIASEVPAEWTVVTVDLWKDFGDFTLTGIAPTAMGGPALFDRIELLPVLPDTPKVGAIKD